MAFVLADRVKETTTSTGTGTITLAGAATGFQSFAAIGNGNSTYYAIAGQGTSEWEVGIGTYTSAGTTLSRTTVLASSNAGSLVSFSAGTKDVIVTQPSERAVYLDPAVSSASSLVYGTGTGALSNVTIGANLTFVGGTLSATGGGGGGTTYIYKTSNYTAANNEGVLTDTTGGAFTVTLPATPSTGYQVIVADAGGAWGTNNLTVGRNGSTIKNLAQDLVCDLNNVSVQFVYDGTTWEIYAQVGANTQTPYAVSSGGTGVTSITGIIKGNGTSAFTAATAGTDYLAPPSGTALLKANSGGALANAVAGTDYLAPPSGTALLKANSGGALANASAGTDYVAPGTATSFTALQTFSGSSSVLAAVFSNSAEVATVSATAATGTINYDVTTQSVLYYTTAAAANWTVNFRASSGTALNTALATGQSVTVAFLVTQGGTAYYNSAVTVDGTSVTPKWQGGTAPSAGNASSIDVYVYTIVKTGAATFTIFASLTQFK